MIETRRLKQIRNNNGLKIDPCWTPAFILAQAETWALSLTLYCLLLKKSIRMFNSLPEMPFCSSLKITPSCQTLSKALDISKKTLLTSIPSSKDLRISWVIDNSWFIQESPGLKPNWWGVINFFSRKNPKHFVKKTFSKNFTTNRKQRDWAIVY